MTHEPQSVQAAFSTDDPEAMQPQAASTSMAIGPVDSLEESEFKERHGEQYHLRHHLSGCAQTLYTIDFENDFSVNATQTQPLPIVTSNAVEALFTADMPHATEEQQDIASPLSTASSSPSLSALAAQDIALTGDMSQPVNSLVLPPMTAQEHIELHQASQSLQVSEHPALSETAPEEPVQPITQPLVANFDDGTLGGWDLNPDQAGEPVLENGQLQFSSQSVQEGEPLLSRSLGVTAGQSYQFEMRIQSSDGGEPPRFELRVGDHVSALEATREGDGFVLRAEFTAESSVVVDVAIVPIYILPSAPSFWLDDLILQPAVPTLPHLEIVQDLPVFADPVLDFDNIAQITVEPGSTAPAKNLDISLMLSPELADLPVNTDVVTSPPLQVAALEMLVGEAETENWNSTASSTLDAPASALSELVALPLLPVTDIDPLVS